VIEQYYRRHLADRPVRAFFVVVVVAGNPIARPTLSSTSTTSAPRKVKRGSDAGEKRGKVSTIVSTRSLRIRVDQGTEFVSRDLDLWAYQRGVALDFSRPGKPTDNAFIEADRSAVDRAQSPWPKSHSAGSHSGDPHAASP